MVNFVVPRDFGGGLDFLAKAKSLRPRPRPAYCKAKPRPQNLALWPRPRPRINITGGDPSLTPTCAGLLEPIGSRLGLLKSTFNAEDFGAIHSWNAGSSPKLQQKSLKPTILVVHGHSRSSLLTFLRSSSPVLVMISSISVPICNHFHLRRANNSRLTPF